MTDYKQKVKALRWCAADKICTTEVNCGYFDKGYFCINALMSDAAAAIEELEKMLADEYKDSEYIVSELESCVRTLTEQRDYWKDKAEKMEMQDESISKFADGEWYRNDKA